MQYRVPIKIISINNRALGMVRSSGRRCSTAAVTATPTWESLPDFVKLAEAYGHVGMAVSDPAELESAMEKAFAMAKDRLVFMDISVDPDEHVYPMQIKFGAMDEMWLEQDGENLMRHIISVLLENESGALSRVVASSPSAATTSRP